MKCVNLWVIAYCTLVVGCSSSTTEDRPNALAETLQSNTVSNCHISRVVSEETQAIIWKAIWNEDRKEVIALDNDRDRDRYTFSEAMSVNDKDIKVLLSDRSLLSLRRSYRVVGNDISFKVLYIKPSNSDEENMIQAELHVVKIEDLKKVHNEGEEILSDLPVSEAEACYTLLAQKVENTVVSVESIGEEGWKDPDKIKSLFDNREIYQTVSSSAWKSSDQSETLNAQTAMNVELIDIITDGRDPISIAFTQSNSEFNDPTSSVRPSIIGLEIPITGSGIPIIGNLMRDNLDDEIFNLDIKKKTLNPFELIFDFSGGRANNQVDFTVSVQTTEFLSQPEDSNQATSQEIETQSIPQSNVQAETPQVQTALQAADHETKNQEQPITEAETESVPQVAVETQLQYQPTTEFEILSPPEMSENCKSSDSFISASEETQSIIWQARWNASQNQIASLRHIRDTYTLLNAVSANGSDISIVISDEDLLIRESRFSRLNTETFQVLYIPNASINDTIQFNLHKLTQEELEPIYLAAKNHEVLLDHPATQMEACYTIKLERMDDTSIFAEYDPDTSSRKENKIKDLFQNRVVFRTTSYSTWVLGNSSDINIMREAATHLELEDISEDERTPLNIAFKHSLPFNDSISSIRLFIVDVKISSWGFLTNNLDNEIFNRHLKGQSLDPFELVFGFSIGESEDKKDFTIGITSVPLAQSE